MALSAGFVRSSFGALRGLSRWIMDSFLGERPLENLLLNKFCDRDEVPVSVQRAVREAQEMVPASVIKTRFNMVASLNTLPLLSRIAAPVLYLRAMKDRLVSARLREELFENIPQIATKEIDAPHLLLQTRPRDCADTILNFLELDEMGGQAEAPTRSTG
jgi:pimeloyl-ACP methyl ester carboxylesterase